MHAITIPYDIPHACTCIYMYAQEVMIFEALRQRPTRLYVSFLVLLTIAIIHILTGTFYLHTNSADIQACYLVKMLIDIPVGMLGAPILE